MILNPNQLVVRTFITFSLTHSAKPFGSALFMNSNKRSWEAMQNSAFRETKASEARSLTDGVRLASPIDKPIIMPWVGFGTYKLGKENSQQATYQAIENGYQAIDTAFIYGGETTERNVGAAIQQAINNGIIPSREDIFLTTKHWRKYHGYDATMQCLRLSLLRLGVEYIDLWLMHWPGPAYSTMNRRKDVDAWSYATIKADDLVRERAETWRAMEDALRQDKVRAIGVSNMTTEHLKRLKQTATIWPPAVNQVELHPLRPQTELLNYCQQEGIVVQAYASLGGQDTGKKTWTQLLGPSKVKRSLLTADPVVELAEKLKVSSSRLLLRWALDKGCAIIPKTVSKERLLENADLFSFSLSQDQVQQLEAEMRNEVERNIPDKAEFEKQTRLCWKNDPLRLLDFD